MHATHDARKTILVVDDDEALRDVLKSLLEDHGYVVETASSAHKALALPRQTKPDLVLVDLVMPIVDGIAFVSALRREPASSHVPVVVMSGAPWQLDENLGTCGLGIRAVLRKPFTLEALLDAVSGSVGAGQVRPSRRE
jgi:two-component system, chemotaxis family, chemotaxis protein CheY